MKIIQHNKKITLRKKITLLQGKIHIIYPIITLLGQNVTELQGINKYFIF